MQLSRKRFSIVLLSGDSFSNTEVHPNEAEVVLIDDYEFQRCGAGITIEDSHDLAHTI